MRNYWLPSRPRFRPAAELLEDRLTPADLLVTTLADVANASDGVLSLREAVARANIPGDDTIAFDPELFTDGPATLTLSGMLTLSDNAGLTTMTGPGAAQLIIRGGTFRILDVAAGADVELSSLTLADGTAPDLEGDGGAIRNAGNLLVSNVVFEGNSGRDGGALANSGTAGVLASTFRSNFATRGGAILNTGTLSLEACLLDNNTADADGGAAFNAGTLHLLSCTLVGNEAVFGGAVATTGTFRAANCTVSGNQSHSGSTAAIDTSTQPDIAGAALTELTNCTIAFNNNVNGASGGVFAGHYRDTEPQPVVRLANTIVANNSGIQFGRSAAAAPGVFVSRGNNLSGDASGQLAAAGDLQNTDPRLGPLAANGALLPTHALLNGSPALDGGNNANANGPTGAALFTDPRGFARRADGPDLDRTRTVDIGAYEVVVSVEDVKQRTTDEDVPLTFDVHIADSALGDLGVTVTSDNDVLLPAERITMTGGGDARTLTFDPVLNRSGSATITVTATRDGQAWTDTFTVVVTPVADAPTLEATSPASGGEGLPIPLAIRQELVDTDGSEELLAVRISGVPTDGVSFNRGTNLGGGVWEFAPDQLAGLTITVADDLVSLPLVVTATSRETDNDTAETVVDLEVVVAPVAPTVMLAGPATFDPRTPLALSLAAFDPGRDVVTSWRIDWDDGSVETVAGNLRTATHTFALVERTHTIRVTATDDDGLTGPVATIVTSALFPDASAKYVARAWFGLMGVPIDAGSLGTWVARIESRRPAQRAAARLAVARQMLRMSTLVPRKRVAFNALVRLYLQLFGTAPNGAARRDAAELHGAGKPAAAVFAVLISGLA